LADRGRGQRRGHEKRQQGADLRRVVRAGFAAGLCWVAAAFGTNYLFEHRSLKLFLINGGYVTLQFTAIGAILGFWH
jgi:hypothetical protein